MSLWLALAVVLVPSVALAQDEKPILVLVIPAERMQELLALADEPLEEPVSGDRQSLFVPTAFYVGAIGAEWLTSSIDCATGCTTRTRTLPTVESLPVAATLGTAINATVLWVSHRWINPRWPRVAESILYGLSLLHGSGATEDALSSRNKLKGTAAP